MPKFCRNQSILSSTVPPLNRCKNAFEIKDSLSFHKRNSKCELVKNACYFTLVRLHHVIKATLEAARTRN
jgi:hypothetical protein